MIGPLTIGRKAAKHGYKRYGVPGAVLAGAGGVGGYVFLKRKFTGGSGGDTDGEEDVIDEDSTSDGASAGDGASTSESASTE